MEHIYCINDFQCSTESLLLEYETNIKDKLHDRINPFVKIIAQQKFHIIKRGIWSDEILDFSSKLPYTQSIMDRVYQFCKFDTVTYRILAPCSSYRWHIDPELECYHIPLATNEGSLFVYDGMNYRMATDKLYYVNNGVPHTFVNSGDTHRIHLIFEKKLKD